MEDENSSSSGGDNFSNKNTVAENSEETIHINIKTMNSNVSTLLVGKKEPVSLLKEKIAKATSVFPEQQCLIFRGRTLKDNHLLSDHFVEDGDTLHLVLRQPAQSEGQNTRNSGEVKITENEDESPYNDLSRIFSYLALNTAGNTSATNTPNMHVNSSQSLDESDPRESQSKLLQSMIVPDSLDTLSAFISYMEHALSVYSGYQSPSPSNAQSVSTSHPLQYPSPNALITVLGRAQKLLSGSAASTLSHILVNLERARISTDLTVRNQIHVEAMHVSTMIYHLGSLFLELGRTISMLHIGDSPAELMVNSGPSVFISESGPNPIMVQPIPQQPDFVCSFPFPPIMNIPFPDPFSFINDRFWDINTPQTGMSASAAAPTADLRTNSGGSSQEQTANLGSAYNSNQTAKNDGTQGNGQTGTLHPNSDSDLDNARYLPENKVSVNVYETGRYPNDSASYYPSDARTKEPKKSESIRNDEKHLIMKADIQELSTPSMAGDTGFTLLNGNDMLDEKNLKTYLQPAAEGIEQRDSPRDVFYNLIQVANQLYGGNRELLNDIGGDNDLINDFMEMLSRQASFQQPG